jgi:hypothetical protein
MGGGRERSPSGAWRVASSSTSSDGAAVRSWGFALEGPVWDRYGQFAGHPLIRWTVTWTVADRRIQIVAIIGATRYYLTLDIENLDARDPDRRPIAILLLLVRRGGMLLPYGVRRHES